LPARERPARRRPDPATPAGPQPAQPAGAAGQGHGRLRGLHRALHRRDRAARLRQADRGPPARDPRGRGRDARAATRRAQLGCGPDRLRGRRGARPAQAGLHADRPDPRAGRRGRRGAEGPHPGL
ncbi:MAG: hypothetical protein AVDCRST_MAG30-730, partial [uncultured Solirubrobacteraceae bacterium]